MTKISNNFTLEEFFRSDTAEILGIDNSTNDPEIISNIHYLVTFLLQPIRDAIKRPMIINSGFRSSKLNDAVGGSKTSQHSKGEAADITLGSKELNEKFMKWLYNEVVELRLNPDQIIEEKDYSWIHISMNKKLNRNQFLLTKDGKTYSEWTP